MSTTTSGAAAARRVKPAAGGPERPERPERPVRPEGPVRPELFADKLRIPRLSLAILRRGRVIDLVEGAAGPRVTVVSGPAGAGKTVACGSWASAAPAGRRVAWLTLDADDQDPARFWGYVQAAPDPGRQDRKSTRLS